jgi:hypothetical protein
MGKQYVNERLMPDSGLWTPVAVNSSMFSSNTRLILNMQGPNGSTSFPDTSGFNHSVSASGGAVISTDQSPFGGGSLYLDGTDDYLEIPSCPELWLGNKLFTLETWLYGVTVSGRRYFIDKRPNDLHGWCLGSEWDGHLTFWGHHLSGWDLTLDAGVNIGTGTWKHVAVSRISSTVFEMHLAGTRVATVTVASAFTLEDGAPGIRIGYTYGSPSERPNCYVGPTRLTIGKAVYSGATITVPTGLF